MSYHYKTLSDIPPVDITALMLPSKDNCKAKGLCFNPGNPVKTNNYVMPKCVPCYIAANLPAILPILSRESCKAKGLCFQDLILPLRGPMIPRKCIPCPSRLYDWSCISLGSRSYPCDPSTLAPKGYEKLYCPGTNPEETNAVVSDDVKCRCCRKRTSTTPDQVGLELALQDAVPGINSRPVSDELNEAEAIKRCWERVDASGIMYAIDPCTGPGSIRGDPVKPPTIRRGDLIFKKPQSFLNKEYLGVQTKYLLIAGAGLVYVGILLS